MTRLFFGFLCFIGGFSEAQTIRGSSVPATVPGSYSASRNNQLLIDKGNNKEPQFLNQQSKVNGPVSLSALLNIYPIVGFTPVTNFPGTFILPSVNNIKIIDARYDTEKSGFLPIGTDMQKRGYATVGIQFNKDLTDWLTEGVIKKYIVTDSNSNRQLVMVIKKCWFSNAASDRYTVSNPKLITTLQYDFDIFTSKELGYYPQKKIIGNISALYNKGNALHQLTDSFLAILKTELQSLNFAARETERNWQSPVDFNDYYNNRIRKATHFEKMPKGVYASYEDFLAMKPSCDSVEIFKKFTNYDRAPLYACLLTGFKEGQNIPCNQFWGYFDGGTLFVNAGSGFFIKLTRSKADYIFFQLKNIQQDNIKKDILEGMKFGETPYLLLRDYTKAFALTYQLDPETGKLY